MRVVFAIYIDKKFNKYLKKINKILNRRPLTFVDRLKIRLCEVQGEFQRTRKTSHNRFHYNFHCIADEDGRCIFDVIQKVTNVVKELCRIYGAMRTIISLNKLFCDFN